MAISEDVRVYEISTASVSSDLNNQQIAFENVNDADLGWKMFGGKNASGESTLFLGKDKAARVSTLVATGNVTIVSGTITIDSLSLSTASAYQVMYGDFAQASTFKWEGSKLRVGSTATPDYLVDVESTLQDQMRLENSNANATSPILMLKKTSASPADNDGCGLISFTGTNDDLSVPEVDYVTIEATSADVSSNSTDGSLFIKTMVSGVQQDTFTLKGGKTGIRNVSPTKDLDIQYESNSSSFEMLPTISVINSSTDLETSGEFNIAALSIKSGNGNVAMDVLTTYDDGWWNGIAGNVRVTTNHPLHFWTNNTKKMTLNAAGQLSVGIETGDGTLHVHTATAGTVTAPSTADDFIVENSTAGGITILTPDDNYATLNFGSPTRNEGASIQWKYTVDGTSMLINVGADGDNIMFYGGANLYGYFDDSALFLEGDLRLNDDAKLRLGNSLQCDIREDAGNMVFDTGLDYIFETGGIQLPDDEKIAFGTALAVSVHEDASDMILNTGADYIFNTGVLRADTARYRRYYHLPLSSLNPGGSGATWLGATSSYNAGWQLNSAGEVLSFQSDIHSDWDGASDMTVEIGFQLAAAGSASDTVDLRLRCWYIGVGDIVTKSQVVEVATVTDGTQFKMYVAEFAINYDEVDNVIDAGDRLSMELNLETDTSEIDDVIIVDASIYYNTTHISYESTDV